ncbi:hypothetical protein [Pseudomonas moraviensis]|uniref:hypothetical protein n=1 Tax=Pseudomonas moraviensis TaxID=321662 RepID=UPI0011614E6F|nr:hypothetical protein [Pseudomonas moraviensis]
MSHKHIEVFRLAADFENCFSDGAWKNHCGLGKLNLNLDTSFNLGNDIGIVYGCAVVEGKASGLPNNKVVHHSHCLKVVCPVVANFLACSGAKASSAVFVNFSLTISGCSPLGYHRASTGYQFASCLVKVGKGIDLLKLL